MLTLRKEGNGVTRGTVNDQLTVLGDQWRQGKHWRCVCECTCGAVVSVLVQCLKRTPASCGCSRKKSRPTCRKYSEKKCPTCGDSFFPCRGRQKYCSKHCLYESGNYNKGGRKHECLQCGAEFVDSRSYAKFCSTLCANTAQTTADRRMIECANCKQTFNAKQDHGRWPKFCSILCLKNTTHAVSDRPCVVCGDSFQAKWRKRSQGYEQCCTARCADQARKTGALVRCVICEAEIWREKKKLTKNINHYCSVECRAMMSTDLCGLSWKDGICRHVAPDGQEYDMLAIDRVNSTLNGHQTRLRYKAHYRLLVEEYIGRPLSSDEPVWHINRDREDNKPINLYVFRSASEMWKSIGRREFPTRSNLDALKNEQAETFKPAQEEIHGST